MHERDPALDLRNVGVALPLRGVNPPKQHPREYDGSHFCVLVSHTTPQPRPGSDDISRAYEEGWVGHEGYLKADGHRQRWALAFIGDTRAENGDKLPEVFIVDLPENESDYAKAGAQPLQGTETTLPAPPQGVQQRRLTHTGDRRYPGVATTPRHWLRSSPDGSEIAFLMQDDRGVVQLWCVSPNGGALRQISHGEQAIQSAFSWHPAGGQIALVCDNSVMLCDVTSGQMRRLTQRSEQPPSGDAVVFSPDGTRVAFMREVAGYNQICVVEVN